MKSNEDTLRIKFSRIRNPDVGDTVFVNEVVRVRVSDMLSSIAAVVGFVYKNEFGFGGSEIDPYGDWEGGGRILLTVRDRKTSRHKYSVTIRHIEIPDELDAVLETLPVSNETLEAMMTEAFERFRKRIAEIDAEADALREAV